MAARLLRIKAQMLLPRHEGDEAWEDPRAELVRRLLEYQQMREVVDVLERRGEERRNRFARALRAARARRAAAGAARALARANCSPPWTACCARRASPTLHEVVPRPLDVRRRDRRPSARCSRCARAPAGATSSRADAEPWEVLSALLALLELARRGELALAQPRPFAERGDLA